MTQSRRLFVRALEARTTPATFVVTTANDTGPGSLRQAVLDANTATGKDAIHFDIPGGGPFVVSPLSPLPEIFDSVTIDGFTQPGSNGKPVVTIDGGKLSGIATLRIVADNSTVRGLVLIHGGGFAIDVPGVGTRVQGNYIGLKADGSTPAGNANGIAVFGSASNTVIGTDGDGIYDAAEGNVIANNEFGISFLDRPERPGNRGAVRLDRPGRESAGLFQLGTRRTRRQLRRRGRGRDVVRRQMV